MSDVTVAAASGVAGVASATFVARFFFERWVNKREATEKELHSEISALREKAELADDEHRAELERTRSSLLDEIRILRDRSHALSNDVGIAVTRTAVNAEMVAEIRNELRNYGARMDSFAKSISDEVGGLKTTIVRLGTILSERLPKSDEREMSR